MKKIELSASEILKKRFNSELTGYNAQEVDAFLDAILRDYNSYEENIAYLEKTIENLNQSISRREDVINKLKLEYDSLRDQLNQKAKLLKTQQLQFQETQTMSFEKEKPDYYED